MTPNEPKKPNFQISELAPSKGGADIDDGQDFDPSSDSVNEVGANDEDMAKNRGAGAKPVTP